jgi:hypothetical protein
MIDPYSGTTGEGLNPSAQFGAAVVSLQPMLPGVFMLAVGAPGQYNSQVG